MTACLIVEGNRMIRAVMQKIVADLGFKVSEAADGAAAFAQVSAALPDAILYDPQVTGAAFPMQVRALPGGAKVRLLPCSGDNSATAIAAALADGADDYIFKPFDAMIVRSKLAMAQAVGHG